MAVSVGHQRLIAEVPRDACPPASRLETTAWRTPHTGATLQMPRMYLFLLSLRPGVLVGRVYSLRDVGRVHSIFCLELSGPASSLSRKVL